MILLSGGGNSLITPDLGLFFWTVVIFVILWFLLGKLAFGPIGKALKNREKSIEDALNKAEQAREEMARLSAENDQILNEAREERNVILKEAKDTANKMVDEAKSKASDEAAKIIADAKKEIETSKNAAMAEVKNEVAMMALSVSETILRKELDNKEAQEKYIATLVEETNAN